MCQMRLTSLGTLAVESELAKQLDFNEIIETFANKKARAAVGTPSIDDLCVLYVYVYVLFFKFALYITHANGKNFSMNIYCIIHYNVYSLG